MGDDRYVVIEKPLRVIIDRELLRNSSINEEELTRIIDTRLSSLVHRMSSWVSETLSTLLIQTQAREKNTGEEDGASEPAPSTGRGRARKAGTLVGVFKMSSGRVVFEYTDKRIRHRKLFVYNGRVYRGRLNGRRYLAESSDLYPVVLELLDKCGGEIPVYWNVHRPEGVYLVLKHEGCEG